MPSEGFSALQVGCYSPLWIKMAVWRTFLEFELAGSGVAAGQPIATIMAVWHASNKKKCAERPLLSAAGCHTRPDHSREWFAERRKAL
jgi:hypothetical protein